MADLSVIVEIDGKQIYAHRVSDPTSREALLLALRTALAHFDNGAAAEAQKKI